MKKKNVIFNALWDNKFLFALIISIYVILIVIASIFKSERPKVPPVDIIIIFDSSSSMIDEIKGMIKISKEFASLLKVNADDFRIGVIVFGCFDEDKIIREKLDFTTNISDVKKFLSMVSAHGGGREDQIYALSYALNFPLREKSKKIFILITDENIGGDEGPTDDGKITSSNYTVDGLINELIKNKVIVYVVGNDDEGYKKISSRTGGVFYHIHGGKKFTDIILDIGEKIVGSLTR